MSIPDPSIPSRFATHFRAAPTHGVTAPGRVNLIGEHIDYNGLSVFPMALDRGIRLVFRAREDALVKVVSSLSGYAPREFELSDTVTPYGPGDWGDYVKAGALAAWTAGQGVRGGMDAYVHSNLPAAAGLSSSSALLIAVLLALLEVNEITADRQELMGMAARAERFVGTQGGGMDQAICLGARTGSATRIDFEPVALTHVPIPGEWRWLVAFSGVRAAKSAAAQAVYNRRTVECREALQHVSRLLGRAGHLSYRVLLSDCSQDELLSCASRCLPTPLEQRFRHVVTEARRVDDAVAAMQAGDEERFGELMVESHVSLRDDYEVSSPELDVLVDAALNAGAVGARLTGAGFGGCIVALVGDRRFETVRTALEDVAAAGRRDAEVFEAAAADAARVDKVE